MVPEVVTPLKLFATSKTMWTLPPLWTHRTRPQGFGNLAKNARFPQPPHRSLFSLTKRKNEEQNHSDQLSTESDHPQYELERSSTISAPPWITSSGSLLVIPHRPRTQFPIFETELGFNDRGTKQFLKNIDVAAIELIKSEQPFFIRKDGTPEGITQSPLWHLKELSDIDKHRTLHIMTTALPAHNLQFPTVAQSFTTVDVQEYSGGPIQQDTVLWTGILHVAKSWPFANGEVKAGLEVEVTFESGTPAPGMWGVHGTLAQLGNRAEHILRRIANEICKTEL